MMHLILFFACCYLYYIYLKNKPILPKPREFKFLLFCKEEHKYLFLYDEKSVPKALEVLNRFANNPELNFTEQDAEKLKEKIIGVVD
jgi:hypothetical protein